MARALRKEPGQRYASATELENDIIRHLEHRCVPARNGTIVYRAGKLVRRHRLAFAAAFGMTRPSSSMARKRKAIESAKGDTRISPIDVLEGYVEVRPEELFDLIHEINPTLRDLPKKVQARRYELKSRLQSLLVRRHGDELLEVEPGGRPGVVSLNHRAGLRNACHAVIAELEPDARAWVLRQLDIAASPEVEEPEPWMEKLRQSEDDDGAGADLLQQGRQAIEDFDYEAAEDLLKRAFEKDGHTSAALALLELHVDLLGMDAQALELEPRLSTAAKRYPGIRTLLALAAARMGESERALELLQGMSANATGLPVSRMAEVYVALVSQALRDEDRAAAERHLERVTELDPAHPEILRLTGEIDKLRSAGLHEVEQELERRYREADAFAVEDEARALVKRWPGSEVARGILREVADARRSAEIAEHLAAADAAFEQARFDGAVRHYQAALDAGSERPDLARRLAEARSRDRERREEHELEAALGRMHRSEPRDVLLIYLSLPAYLRPRLRERRPWPALEWIEASGSPPSGSKAQAMTTAILALEQATLAEGRGDARAALGTLEPHRGLLREVPHARQLEREVRARVQEEDRRQATENLESALGALAEGRLWAARGLFDRICGDDLAADDRPRATDLALRIEHAEKVDRWQQSYERCLRSGDVTGALAAARRLKRLTEGGARRAWDESVARLRARLHRNWSYEAVSGELSLTPALPPAHSREKSVCWLTEGGKEMVLANAWDDWLFVSIVDVERQVVTRRISMRTPERLVFPLFTSVDGDRVWIAGREGRAVELSCHDWTVLGYYAFGELAGGRTVSQIVPIPKSDYVWIRSEFYDMVDVRNFVIDVWEWRVANEISSRFSKFTPIIDRQGTRVLVSDHGLGAFFHNVDGTRQSREAITPYYCEDAAPGPGGRDLLALIWATHAAHELLDEEILSGDAKEVENRQKTSRVLLRLEESEDGAFPNTAHLLFKDVLMLGFNGIVTCLDQEISLVFYDAGDQKATLVFDPRSFRETFEPIRRYRLPGGSLIVHDREARKVVASSRVGGQEILITLGAREPEIPEAPKKRQANGSFPHFSNYFSCGAPGGETGEKLEEIKSHIGTLDRRGAMTYLLGLEHEERWEEVALAASVCFDKYLAWKVVEDTVRRLQKQHPTRGDFALLLATREIREDRWSAALRILRPADAGGLDERRASHFYHVLGLAYFHASKMAKAHTAFKKAAAYEESNCAARSLAHLTQPMSSPPKKKEWGPDQPWVRQIVGAVRTVDHARKKGNLKGARAVVDDPELLWHHEVQLAARRADVYLGLDAATPAERFHQRAVLALYSNMWKHMEYMRRNLNLPGVTWDDERLDDLVQRVDEALKDL